MANMCFQETMLIMTGKCCSKAALRPMDSRRRVDEQLQCLTEQTQVILWFCSWGDIQLCSVINKSMNQVTSAHKLLAVILKGQALVWCVSILLHFAAACSHSYTHLRKIYSLLQPLGSQIGHWWAGFFPISCALRGKIHFLEMNVCAAGCTPWAHYINTVVTVSLPSVTSWTIIIPFVKTSLLLFLMSVMFFPHVDHQQLNQSHICNSCDCGCNCDWLCRAEPSAANETSTRDDKVLQTVRKSKLS